MHYFSYKFLKITKSRPSILHGNLKLRDSTKLCVFKQIMTKSNFKNQL